MNTHQELGFRSLRRLRDLPVYKPGKPIIGSTQALLADPITFHLEPYRRFGPLYRMRLVSRQHLVMAGLEANEFIWRNSQLWNYNQRMVIFRAGYDDKAVLQLDGEPHRKKHRRMVQGHKYSALIPLASQMERALASEIDALTGGQADLRALCKRVTSCMTYRAILQLDLPDGVDAKIDAFSQYVLAGDIYNMLAGYRLGGALEPLLQLWYRRPVYKRMVGELLDLIGQVLDERERNPPQQDDILSHMLKSHPADEPPLSRAEIASDVLFLFPAGTEPTSHLLLWALMYVYHDPEWLAALREELHGWTPESVQNLNEWPRLKATLIETERVRPLLPNFILIAAQDFEYQGVHVPKGTPVLHAAAVTHFLPEIYPDPLNFKPDRFLTGTGYPPGRAHTTYGGGAHSCIGQSLARVEALVGLAHIVANYDLEFERAPSFRPSMGVVLTPSEPALPMRFVPRRAA